jgi:S-adenosylmethionine:tRNA ribosyltransferase-isomerase
MPTRFEKLLSQYDYAFPESAVALEPSVPRDAAKLAVIDPSDGSARFSTFRDIVQFLPPRSVLVLNETKVIPARVEAVKPTGGKVRILYVGAAGKRRFHGLADRPIEVGSTVAVGKAALTVVSRETGDYVFEVTGMAPLTLFKKHGRTPIPPYLKRTKLSEKTLREQYQTVFAKNEGSVAAPTASLHFTKKLLADIKKAGHDIAYVTLHVNMGTFAPLTAQAVAEGRLHEETYRIAPATVRMLMRAKNAGRPIIPVGTTALRTLEAASDERGVLRWPECATRLFISPGYRFAFVDGLVTNFHVPKSSLLMLVAALVGRERLLRLYRTAIQRGFKLFSFGDGMLILPKPKVRRP